MDIIDYLIYRDLWSWLRNYQNEIIFFEDNHGSISFKYHINPF